MHLLKRELRIAFSKHAQPVWIRMLRWTGFVGVSALPYRTSCFGYGVSGLPTLGLVVHFFLSLENEGMDPALTRVSPRAPGATDLLKTPSVAGGLSSQALVKLAANATA